MSSEQPAPVPTDRRLGPDRRRHNFWRALFSKHRRRRNTGRRAQDTIGYVDYYDRKTWLLAGLLFGLSLLDAAFTGFEISGGSVREANPLMRLTMSQGGMGAFFAIKAALTALPLAILMMHKEWRLARITVWVCISSYLLINLYHLYIVFGCPA